MPASNTKTILEAVTAALKASIGVGSGATHTIALAQFYERKFPFESGVVYPAVFVYPRPEKLNDATNASDDWGFGVGVTIAQTTNRDLAADADRLYYWRERTMQLFNGKRLAGLTRCWCKVEPGDVIDPNAFRANRDATAYVVRVWDRITTR